MPSKLTIDREKNTGFMPSKLIGPPIRWKENEKKNIIIYFTRLNIIVISLS